LAAASLAVTGGPAATVTDLTVGAPTPAFTLATAEGGEVALRDEYGQPIVLVFADPGQQHSREGLAEVADVVSGGDYREEAKVFVIVADAPELGALDVPFPILLDPERSTFAEHGVISVLPCVVFLDRDGLLHHALAGHGVGFADTVEDELAFLTGRITREELLARRGGTEPVDLEDTTLKRRLRLADQMRQRGLIDQARAVYEDVLSETADSPGAHVGLALIAMRRDDLETAETHVRNALESEPELPLGHKALAHVLLLRNDTQGAETAIQHFVTIAGEDVETHYLMGRLEEARGDPGAAARHYRHVCEALLADREWGIFTER
jgi:tetratricopeptide (TPR) repeat protein